MPKIVVKRKAEVHKEFPIRPFQSRITIGSEGDNDLIIADKKVSMHHLVIEKEGTHYFVQDNQSAFGSFLNGKRITGRVPLSSSDEIKIGDHSLIFENILFEKSNAVGDLATLETDEAVETISDEPLSRLETEAEIKVVEMEELEAEKETPAAPGVPHQIPVEGLSPHCLLAIYGPYLGKKYRLNYGVTKIGRDNTLNDIVIRENSKKEIDPSISRRHATVYLENGNYFIMDKRSKTRTRVNRQQLGEEDVVQLSPWDEIEIVSDQKSTIFRFLPEALMDFSPPKKAGDWWVRNSTLAIRVASVVISVLLLMLLIRSWTRINVINQKPSPLQFTEESFMGPAAASTSPRSANQVIGFMQSLAPAVADFDGDGYVDLAYVGTAGDLKVFSGKTIKPLWKKPLPSPVQQRLGVVIADLNNNGLADILVPANNSMLYALDGNSGSEIWSSPLFGGLFSGNPVIADLNGDGLQDVFIGSQTGQVHIGYGGFGNPEWSTLQVEAEIYSTPSAGDIDNDGLPEVLLGTENGKILIYDGSKNNFSQIIDVNEEFQKAKGSFFEDHPIRQPIAIGKLDADSYNDFVVLTEDNHIMALNGKDSKRLWFDELEAGVSGRTVAPPALADLNGDGDLEVVLVTNNNTIIAYEGAGRGAGQKKINWGYISENQDQFVTSPVLADVNKDNAVDVLVAGFQAGLYIFNGPDGKIIPGTDRVITPESAIIGVPLVADFKKDGSLDILLRKNDDSFSILQTNSRVEPGAVHWGQIYFDARQSGCNAFSRLSTAKFYLAIVVSLLLILGLCGYNIYEPIRRRNLFLKTT